MAHYILFIGDIFHVIILSILLIFHMYRLHQSSKTFVSNQDGSTRNPFCVIFSLRNLSYVIILSALFRGILNLTKVTIHEFMLSYLNTTTCSTLELINLELSLISHFAVDMFVALRSRLSSSDITRPSIWFKMGLLLILTDLGLIIFPFIQPTLVTYYHDNCCIVHWVNPILIIWILCSEICIGIYSLLVFVIPLKKHIKYERELSPRSKKEFRSSSVIQDQKTLEQLVIKIMIYSTLMILSTIIFMPITWIFNLEQFKNTHILSAFGPVHMTFVSYCIVMQFKDAKTEKIESSFCRGIVGFCQCDFCGDCRCMERINIDQAMVIQELEVNQSNTVSDTKSTVDGQTKNDVVCVEMEVDDDNLNMNDNGEIPERPKLSLNVRSESQ